MIVVVVLSAAAVAGLFVNAKMGFGFSLVVVPLASLIVGFGPAVLFVIVLEVFLSLSMAWVLRRELRLLDASLLKLGSFIGILCAWLMSRYVSGQTATIAGMAAVIVSCIYILAAGGMKDKVPPRGWILPALGALSGLLNYWTSLSGPPVVLAYARSDVKPAKIVAILTGYFS
ncbi:MAG: TSUP family transporter, partial [Terracidiphilus sp.]